MNNSVNKKRESQTLKKGLNMKLSTLFLMFFLTSISTVLYSQSNKLSIEATDMSIKEILHQIEEKTNYRFIYKTENTNLDKKVTFSVKDQNVEVVLDKLFKNQGINYQITQNNLIIINPVKEQEQGRTEEGKRQRRLTPITGIIKDGQGEPVIGAAIVETGTTNGTQTNVDGAFSLNVTENAVIRITYIGHLEQNISTEGKTFFDIELREDPKILDEVVVVGYGTVRREAVTGAVAKANLDTYKDVPSNNVLDMIKGSVPGLNIGGVNQTGQVADLSIRGQNSTAAGNSPLLVVDGAIFNGTLADISPYDIENLTVLKDASAAAVYGSRSANGVVLIETKRGTGIEGKPVFNVNLNYGVSNEMERLKLYEGNAYLQRLLDTRIADGLDADPSKIDIYLTEEERKNYMATSDHTPTLTDPYDLIRQQGFNQNMNVSVSNRTNNMRYYIGTTFINQRGVVLNDMYKNITARINIDSDITSWLNIGIKSFYSFRDESGATPPNTAVMFSPWASVYNDDGTYKQFPQTTTSFNSPFWGIPTESYANYHNLNGIFNAIIKVPKIEGLSFTTTFSNSIRWDESGSFYNEYTVEGQGKNGVGRRGFNRTNNMLWDNLIKYNNTFNQKHNVDITLLASQEKSSWRNEDLRSQDFENMLLGTYKLENGKIQTVDTGGGSTEALGLMARATYTFNRKYSITGTIRRDGYSAFSKNKKYGTFPSIGLNWTLSEEGFLNDVKAIDNLAIRASYGSNGNQSISAYQTLAKIATDKYIFAGDPSYSITQYISSLANNDLSWESTTGLNLGLDFSVLSYRISGSVNYYQTNTNNLLFTLPLPSTSGMSSILSNVGGIKNKGVEISLNTVPVNNKNFKWNSDFSFSLNRNKVVSIFGEDNDGDGIEDDLINAGYFIGKSLGTIYDYKVIGMWQQEDVDNGTIMTGMRPGDYKIEDVDGEGAITSDKDRQFIGTSKENFRWSWTNTLQYRDFSLMLYFYSVWGGNGYFLSGSNTPYLDTYAGRGDINHPVYDYWTPDNTDAKYPRLDYWRATYKSRKYVDRSFIKLQKIAFSYDITRLVKPYDINNLKATFSADNLFTYAPYWDGLDPETSQGLNDTTRPSIRTYSLSLSINF